MNCTNLLLAACLTFAALSASADDNEAAIESAKNTISSQLKDPDAAQYRNLSAFDDGKGKTVCGEVNGKNSYGAYIGYRKFYVYVGRGSGVIKSGDKIMDRLVDLVCKPQS